MRTPCGVVRGGGYEVVSLPSFANHYGVGSGGYFPMLIGSNHPPPLRQPTCVSEKVVHSNLIPGPPQRIGSGNNEGAVYAGAVPEARQTARSCNG